MTAPRIFFMMAEKVWPNPNPVLIECIDIIRNTGAEVRVGIGHTEPPLDFDLYVLKSKSQYWLNRAERLRKENGAEFVDPISARILSMDKVALYERLRGEGIPVPDVLDFRTQEEFDRLSADQDLILKPRNGGWGHGITVIPRGGAAGIQNPDSTTTVVQEFVEHEIDDVKIYAIGDHLHAVRKQFRRDSYLSAGRTWPLSDELREITHRCSMACRISLFGIDVILTPRGPMVVDLNWFPSYRSVPDAGQILAELVLRRAQVEAFLR